jgi:hypothetical protein
LGLRTLLLTRPPPAPRYRPLDRDRCSHASLDQPLPHDHEVRAVWHVVQPIDLAAFHARVTAVEGHPGKPPFRPDVLFAREQRQGRRFRRRGWLKARLEALGQALARNVGRLLALPVPGAATALTVRAGVSEQAWQRAAKAKGQDRVERQEAGATVERVVGRPRKSDQPITSQTRQREFRLSFAEKSWYGGRNDFRRLGQKILNKVRSFCPISYVY